MHWGDLDRDGFIDRISLEPEYDSITLYYGNTFGPQVHGIAAANSGTSGAHLSWSGSRSVAANDFTLHVTGCPAGEFGLFFYGPERGQTPFGQHGYLNVAPGGIGLTRVPPRLLTDSAGSVSKTFDFTAPPMNSGVAEIEPGSTWSFQFWYRDPGVGFNLSDAIEVVFCP